MDAADLQEQARRQALANLVDKVGMQLPVEVLAIVHYVFYGTGRKPVAEPKVVKGVLSCIVEALRETYKSGDSIPPDLKQRFRDIQNIVQKTPQQKRAFWRR